MQLAYKCIKKKDKNILKRQSDKTDFSFVIALAFHYFCVQIDLMVFL